MSYPGYKDFSFITNRGPIETLRIEKNFPRWVHYLEGDDVQRYPSRDENITKRLEARYGLK